MRRLRLPSAIVLTFLTIEFLDELVDGVRSAAWPLIRNDLNLTYVQIGLLFAVQGILASCIGILGDVGYRRLLMVGGGVAFAAALGLVSISQGFVVLLFAWIIFFPASGSFVNLAQASLMDIDPSRHEQNMARWVLSGSAANVVGPLALAVALSLGLGWRGMFLSIAILTVPAVVAASRVPLERASHDLGDEAHTFVEGLRKALRRFAVVRWLVLLEASDLMLEIFKGFLALYMVDVIGVSEQQGALTCGRMVGGRPSRRFVADTSP